MASLIRPKTCLKNAFCQKLRVIRTNLNLHQFIRLATPTQILLLWIEAQIASPQNLKIKKLDCPTRDRSLVCSKRHKRCHNTSNLSLSQVIKFTFMTRNNSESSQKRHLTAENCRQWRASGKTAHQTRTLQKTSKAINLFQLSMVRKRFFPTTFKNDCRAKSEVSTICQAWILVNLYKNPES